MRAYHKAKLKDLGIEVSRIYSNASTDVWPPVWGISLTKGRDVLYIEHTPRSYDTDSKGRFYIKEEQYGKPDPLMSYKTQREAIAGCISIWYNVR